MFYQYGTDTNNKIIDTYLTVITVSQVYNIIIHDSLKSNHKKKYIFAGIKKYV
jgi:hypothetical protein